jgi:adenosylhomocysteinase
MDMSFSTQALVVEHALKNRGKLESKIYDVPQEVESWIGRLKLKTLGIDIDTPTAEQKAYMTSWQEGT